MTPSRQLLRLVNGYQVSQAISAAATLGISDVLAAGPCTVDALAAATSTHGPTLHRLLRALATIGIYTCDDEGRYANTELGEQLRTRVDGSLAGWAVYVGRPYYRAAWTGLVDSVRTGANAFARVHGMSVWEYRVQHPDEQVIFDAAMSATAGPELAAIVGHYDFGAFGTVADIGGSRGALMIAILRAYPAVRGVLFDQPAVVAGAAPVLQSAGVAERCEVVGGSFFDGVPTGADAYVLKSIIHDWRDVDAVEILRTCRRAMRDDGTLLLVERLIGRGPDLAHTAFGDLNMLVSPGGQERTYEQYAALLASAGFSLVGVTETGTPSFVIEAAPSP